MAGCISEPRNKSRLLLLAGFVCTALSFGAPGSKVSAVRFWSLGDVTRVAIEVSSEFHYKSERLHNPDRLFFDVEDARPQMVDKGMYVINVGDGLLKQIRIAETHPGVTRVVLDLNDEHTEFTASQLSSPDRLMIELRLKDRPAPPPTTSVSGVKALTGPPSTAVAADLIAAPAPLAKPEPRKFEPPLVYDPPKVESKPELLAQPPLALSAKTAKVSSPAPPVTTATARVTPPPPDPVATARVVTSPVLAAPLPTATVVRTEPSTEPLPAKKNANGDRSLTRVLGLKLGRVVLDPGHGGHDAGTHGPSGLYEKEVVLDVAKRLGALLEERLGSEVIYTRLDDTYVPLEQRTQIANDKKADLFLSIHANSSPYRAVAGVETYYLNFTTSKAALDVAARENASSERSVFDLKELLQKIALRDKIDESREFASRVEVSLYGVSSKTNPTAKNRGVKKAPFVVLIGASMPSVLAEIGFLTNASDETLLRKTEHRQKIAEALYKGIASYADTLSHFQVAKRD
jgi:N-acetylmuramoyl-L-alanine amidase